ncbi:AAA family ATPase [Pseudomonas aeruginosa]|uniref:ATP-binding protein n=2 Tax=Pseudomonas aeruginosa TaxID=287 RepID=UPI0009A26B3F|nr:ATP-binding protein [Pseudomonas aeruginosa]MBX5687836.1 AAA family ATPase [Pseudomonas aeruginosa]MBX5790820.1 AAA family ATPase [Pseudomonas aeruginosa]MCT5138862.1 AAA family ATPase [Pseudomonas aeruginosa]MDP5672101.1 AAA family ATPase [Pseudomonas aeruginosa]HEP9227084.1 AAA family ATPase [Pseudomonas aeruginosa]
MTLLEPTLKVNKLIVKQGGHNAFDCILHGGVNVIRGRNSSGKTTIMDLLAYSLGAENIRWKPQALSCSFTIVEVELNNSPVTLMREISEQSQRPLSFYWGVLDDALTAGPSEWERYPFKRSEQKISFTQALFTGLGMPQAQGSGASNLTMHQLLRVLYADQPSVHSPIFRIDSFDSALTRETIGSYLCGVYIDELYNAQLKSREIEKELDKKISELRGIFNILGKSGQAPDIVESNGLIKELENKRTKLLEVLDSLKSGRELSRKEKNEAGKALDGLRKRLNAAKSYESILKDGLASTELEILDSKLFIKELSSRADSLDESKSTRDYLGGLSFQFCPSCLTEITTSDSEHACHLCKSKLESKNGAQILRMRNELNIQIKESNILLRIKEKEAAKLRLDLPLATQEVKSLEKEYKAASSTWSSDVEIKLEQTSRELGGLDEEIKRAYEKQKLASVISELQRQRDRLSSELNTLKDRITSLEATQEARKKAVSRAVEKNMIRLLKLDLPLQVEFENAETVRYDFEENSVYVNGSRNFSESSAVVLRHLFHLALLTTSMELDYMRLPRFMMLDGIDDGGMEKNRSHNLQRIIVDECAKYNHPFQLIFATSEVTPEIEESNLVVSRYFEPSSRSLDVRD